MRTVSRIVVMLALTGLAPTMMSARARKKHVGHHAAHAVHAGYHARNGTRAVHETLDNSPFFDEKAFDNPATVSPDVLRVLARTDAAKDVLDSAAESGKVDTAQMFRAREVHLNSGKDVDLVVIGTPPKAGLYPEWFWVVRSARTNPEVVLYAGSSSLKLLESRTNGYRDILMETPVASKTHCVTYHFDGNRYGISQEKWADSAGQPGAGCEGR